MAPKEQFKMSPKQLQEAWGRAHKVKDEIAQGFVPEQGNYLLAVVGATRGASKASGRDQVRWDVVFLDGDYEGKEKAFFDGLDREESLPFLMRRIEALGYEAPESPDELEAVLKQINKDRPRFKGRIKTNGDFQNLYIDKLLEDGDGPDIPATKAAANGNGTKKTEVSKETQKAEKEAASGGDDELKVGMEIGVNDEDGKDLGTGTIVALDEEQGEVTVKLASTGKKIIVPPEQLKAVEEAPKAKAKGGMKLKK